jgi:hypothetical protein
MLRTMIVFAHCCLIFGLGNSYSHANPKSKGQIPPIAHIAGFTVGVDTIEKMETRFGHGSVFTGGHPNGGRSWMLKPIGWKITADGFDYNKRGRVISSFEVATLDELSDNAGPARASAPKHKLIFMNTIAIGMSRSNVLHLLKRKLPKPATAGQDLQWTMHGRAKNNNTTYTTWTAKLHFEHDQLDYIDVECD